MKKIVLLKEIDYKTKDKVSITIHNDMDPWQDNVTITFSGIFKRENGEISKVYQKMKTTTYGGWFEMYYNGFINDGYRIIKDN